MTYAVDKCGITKNAPELPIGRFLKAEFLGGNRVILIVTAVSMEDEVNAFLAPLALLNDGTNHGSSYELVRMPQADSLIASISLYFESLSTSIVQPQSAENWNLRTVPIKCEWKSHVQKVAKRWFFAQEFSPKVESWVAENVAECFTSKLQPVIGDARIYTLQITSPMWYECVWEDIAIESRNGRWLLHFGFSD